MAAPDAQILLSAVAVLLDSLLWIYISHYLYVTASLIPVKVLLTAIIDAQ